MLRRVSVLELCHMGVKNGPDLSLPQGKDVALAKAMICEELERLHGTDFSLWIRILKRVQKKVARASKEPFRTAIRQLLTELEAEMKNGDSVCC